jgi:hypothetical protein
MASHKFDMGVIFTYWITVRMRSGEDVFLIEDDPINCLVVDV